MAGKLTYQPRIQWPCEPGKEQPYLGLQAKSWNWLLQHSPCSYCGKSFEETEMTIDHIRPKARWLKKGRGIVAKRMRQAWISLYNDRGNMNYNTASACWNCNQAKGTKELLHFLLERTA